MTDYSFRPEPIQTKLVPYRCEAQENQSCPLVSLCC